MKTLRHVLALSLVALGCALGCSDDEDATSAIGELCSASMPCEEGARCDARDFCTKNCGDHSDCGCAEGTVDSDVGASKCQVACERGLCVKACRTDSECAGTTQCLGGLVYSTCE